VIIRGNSGGGKTTVAKALQKRLGHGTMLISQDAVRREIVYVRDTPGNLAAGLLIHLVEFARKNCETAILEGILSSDIYAGLFETAVNLYKNSVYAYYYDLDFGETLKRHSQKPNKDDFGEPEMRRWWRERDMIPLLNETVFGAEISAADAVERICGDIGK